MSERTMQVEDADMSTEEQQLFHRHRLTIDEYYQMGEAGILAPDARTELIEGEIIDMPPIGRSHASVVDHLTRILVIALQDCAVVRVQGPIDLGDRSQPLPDAIVLRPSKSFYREARTTARDALLVVEVCDSSYAYDRNIKLPLYARHGIPEVWLFELRANRVHFFSEPVDGRYQQSSTIESPGFVRLAALSDSPPIDLAGVL